MRNSLPKQNNSAGLTHHVKKLTDKVTKLCLSRMSLTSIHSALALFLDNLQ